MDESCVNDPIGCGCSAAQTFEVSQISAMHLGPCSLKRLGTRIGSGEAQQLMTCFDELLDDCRTNKARCPCHENFHNRSFFSRNRNTKLIHRLACCRNTLGNRVQRGDRVRRQFQCCSSEVLSEMADGRSAGNGQNVRRPLKKPGKRDLRRSGLQGCRYLVELRRLQRRESFQREEWDIGDALLCKSIDEGVVIAMCQIVEVLDANNIRDSLTHLQLPETDVSEADAA